MKEEVKALTYRQLKDFVNEIEEKHLDQPAVAYPEEGAGYSIFDVTINPDKTVVVDGDEKYIISESDYEFANQNERPEDRDPIVATFDPGFPMIWIK